LKRAHAGELPGTVDHLLDVLADEPRMRPLDQTAITVDLPSECGGSLHVIPAGAAPAQAYWKALEQLHHTLRIKPRNGELPEAVMELRSRIADELGAEFLLIDARTGITELGGLTTSILADRVVCLTTTAPESVEGTRIVAEALRSAPRLPSQQPLHIDFLITRVLSETSRSARVSQVVGQLGGTGKVLPHDSEIACDGRVYPFAHQDRGADTDQRNVSGRGLFDATLDWIAEAFPGHKREAELARHRMSAVHEAWRYLTNPTERRRGWTGRRAAWPSDQIRERVRFDHSNESRLADLVVYTVPAKGSASDPLMIIEYVHSEDGDAVAKWWLDATRTPVVVILSSGADRRRIYSGGERWSGRTRHSDRWDLPLPHDFEALSDPTDVSIDSLLEVLRESGHRGRPLRMPSGLLAVAQLARDILGLQYDPDATFRRQGQRILEQSELDTDPDYDRGLYGLTPAFQNNEITFGISADSPPLAMAGIVKEKVIKEPMDIGLLISKRVATNSLVTTGLLGNYEPGNGRVVLYSNAISECAERLALQARHVGSVTLIHETLHALTHLGHDLDGHMWAEFTLPPVDSLQFEPGAFHETLTQYFTFQHIVRLKDPALLNAFEVMSARQASCYQTWQRLREFPIEDARNWLMSVRRGVGASAALSYFLRD